MCVRCDELEEEVAYLRSELGLSTSADIYDRLRASIELTPIFYQIGRRGPVRLVSTLYAANGRTMSKSQLMEAIPPRGDTDDERMDKIIDVWVSLARRWLGRDGIATIWGRGYRLTPAGMAQVKAIIEPPTPSTSPDLNDMRSLDISSREPAHTSGSALEKR